MNLDNAFQELRRADAVEAPPSVELALRRELRRRHMVRRVWMGWAIAAGLAISFFSQQLAPGPAPRPPGPSIAIRIPPTARPLPVSRAIVPRAPRMRSSQRAVAENFVVLPGAHAPMESGVFMRVELPLTSGDRVQAEVLVGEDGRARTIRFLQ